MLLKLCLGNLDIVYGTRERDSLIFQLLIYEYANTNSVTGINTVILLTRVSTYYIQQHPYV